MKEAVKILNENGVKINSLPENGNMGLSKKEIKLFVKEKLCIDVTKKKKQQKQGTPIGNYLFESFIHHNHFNVI